jgi:uncharacterized RDD family membrane protein YckC
MRKINIITTQNVTIEYELATVAERFSSSVIDGIIILVTSFALFQLWTSSGNGSNFIPFQFFLFPISFLYHLLFETFNNGQTLGKKFLKIRVVKTNGEHPGFFDFLMRTVFRLVDITVSMGTLAMIMVSSSAKGQRLGDFFADTTVVRLLNANRFSLNRILSMDKLKQSEPKYPGVIKFTEDEMMLIKETIDRCKMYPNQGHKEALELLIKKIEGQLNVVAPDDRLLFLNTLIRDYVSLTR